MSFNNSASLNNISNFNEIPNFNAPSFEINPSYKNKITLGNKKRIIQKKRYYYDPIVLDSESFNQIISNSTKTFDSITDSPSLHIRSSSNSSSEMDKK